MEQYDYQSNITLKDRALETLKGHWDIAVITTLVIFVIMSAVSPITFYRHIFYLGGILQILILPVLFYGSITMYLKLSKEGNFSLNDLFSGFNRYSNVLVTMLLVWVYIFLWTLLFVIPGIIKVLSYSMTPFIIMENPELSANRAIEKSMQMMKGNKTRLFILLLSFIGWFILSMFTFCIGLLWLIPYVSSTIAQFYLTLKAEQGLNEQIIQ